MFINFIILLINVCRFLSDNHEKYFTKQYEQAKPSYISKYEAEESKQKLETEESKQK